MESHADTEGNVIDYKDLNKTDSFSKLKAIKPFDIKRKLNAKRIEGASIKEAGSLVYNYGAMPVDDETIKVLQESFVKARRFMEKHPSAPIRFSRTSCRENTPLPIWLVYRKTSASN